MHASDATLIPASSVLLSVDPSHSTFFFTFPVFLGGFGITAPAHQHATWVSGLVAFVVPEQKGGGGEKRGLLG